MTTRVRWPPKLWSTGNKLHWFGSVSRWKRFGRAKNWLRGCKSRKILQIGKRSEDSGRLAHILLESASALDCFGKLSLFWPRDCRIFHCRRHDAIERSPGRLNFACEHWAQTAFQRPE